MTTPHGAPELAASQALPETTVNQQVRQTEAGANFYCVADNDLTAPPGTCADGSTYIIAASPTGAWSGKAGQIATANGSNASGGWLYRVPEEGIFAWIVDENVLHYYDGAVWGPYVATGANPTECLIVAVCDESSSITTGTNKLRFRMPYAFTLSAVRASVGDAQASGSILTVDINENGTSILSTKLTIDNTEKTSVTAAAAAVISDSSLADDAEMSIDIDQMGDGTAKGLKVYLIGNRT